jgi:hypothetical protein
MEIIKKIKTKEEFNSLLMVKNSFYLFFSVDWSVQSSVARRKILAILSHIKQVIDIYEIDVSSQDLDFIEEWLDINKTDFSNVSKYVHVYVGGEGGLLYVEDKQIKKVNKRVYLMTDEEIKKFFENPESPRVSS